jgi:hypothetical protein
VGVAEIATARTDSLPTGMSGVRLAKEEEISFSLELFNSTPI